MAKEVKTFAPVRVGGYNPQAIAFAAKIEGKIIEHLGVIFGADLIKKTGKAVIRDDIIKLFQKKERDTMPSLDSGRVNGGPGIGWVADRSTNNPDWTVVLEGKRNRWVSYFDTMVMRSPYGMQKLGESENLKAQAKASEKISEKLELANKAETIEAEIKNYCLNFRGAMELLQKEDAAVDLYPELQVNYLRDKNKNIQQVKYPMQLWDKDAPLEGENFTLSQFLGLDFQKVADFQKAYDEGVKAGTTEEMDKKALGSARWQILLTTKKREPDTDIDEDNIEINNTARFETGSASMLHWLRNEQNVARLRARFENSKTFEDNVDFIKTIVNLSIEFNALASELKKPRKGGKGSLYEQAEMFVEADDDEVETTEDDSEDAA